MGPRCSLEGLMLKLKLQYFGHLMWRVDSLEKTLMLGGIGGRGRRGRQRMRWLDSIINSMDISSVQSLSRVWLFATQRIDAFELWCWRRLLRAPWTAKRPNRSILKDISPRCSLEGLMLKLKFQSFGHLMGRADSFEKTLMLGKIEGRKRRGWQRMRWVGWHHWFNGHEFVWILGVGDRQGSLACFMRSMGSQRVGHDWATELNWTELNWSPTAAPSQLPSYTKVGASTDPSETSPFI